MRPRVFPAEDFVIGLQTVRLSFNEAAGIPRAHVELEMAPAPYSASMRPRVFPAEDGQAGRLRPQVHPELQ